MANYFIDKIIQDIKKTQKVVRIAFPEGDNLLIQAAADELCNSGIITPVLFFNNKSAYNNYQGLGEKIFVDQDMNSKMVDYLYELRQPKNTKDQCQTMLKSTIYQAMLFLHQDKVDAFVGGISCPTGNILRPAFQIIKPEKKYNIVSSGFVMLKEKETLIFGDCSTNVDPNSAQMAEIGFQNFELAQMVGLDPKIAFLSFSTFGSAKHEKVEKVNTAVKIFHDKFLGPLNFDSEKFIDSEIQFDAAYDENVRLKKSGKKYFAGSANVYIFPNLAAGNIGYKIAQRLGGYKAIGPILLGINKPVNDLSRGANTEEIVNTSILTAMQFLDKIRHN